MTNRIKYFFDSWYQPKYKMATEDWLYVAALIWLSVVGFNIGLVIGWIWTKLI